MFYSRKQSLPTSQPSSVDILENIFSKNIIWVSLMRCQPDFQILYVICWLCDILSRYMWCLFQLILWHLPICFSGSTLLDSPETKCTAGDMWRKEEMWRKVFPQKAKIYFTVEKSFPSKEKYISQWRKFVSKGKNISRNQVPSLPRLLPRLFKAFEVEVLCVY